MLKGKLETLVNERGVLEKNFEELRDDYHKQITVNNGNTDQLGRMVNSLQKDVRKDRFFYIWFLQKMEYLRLTRYDFMVKHFKF